MTATCTLTHDEEFTEIMTAKDVDIRRPQHMTKQHQQIQQQIHSLCASQQQQQQQQQSVVVTSNSNTLVNDMFLTSKKSTSVKTGVYNTAIEGIGREKYRIDFGFIMKLLS